MSPLSLVSGEGRLISGGVDSIPGGRSTKSKIVDILSREWPLSCRKIYNRLVRENGADITYQAVHKAVLQMTEEGILVKKSMDYSLNIDWVNQIGRFSKDVSDAYISGKRAETLEGDVTQHDFDCGYDAIRFLIDNFSQGKMFPINSERITIHAKVQHMWNPFVLVPSDFGKLKGFAGRIEVKIACKGDTQLDRIVAKFYNALGIKTCLGADVSETPEIIVFGESVVVQIFNPAEMRELLSRTYQRTKTIFSPELMKNFHEIAYGRGKVTVLVNRNAIAAAGINQEILSKFKGHGCPRKKMKK